MVWEMAVLMAVLWAQLRLHSTGQLLKRTDAIIRISPPRSLPPGWDTLEFARRCDQLAAIAAYHGFYHATCLPRSLALYRVLAVHGVPARLRIGVLPGSKPLQAHAWVECGNEVLGDPVTGFRSLMSMQRVDNI